MQEGNSFTSSRGQLFSKNLPESIIFWGIYSCIEWRKKWPRTPVLLPGKSHGQRSLVGYSPWGCEESDTTEWLHFRFSLSCVGEGNDNLLQYSCLENPRDRGSWWTAIYGVAQGWTQLKRLSNSSSSSSMYHKIHPFKMYISVVLGYSQSCTTITTNFRTFLSPQEVPYPLAVTLHSSLLWLIHFLSPWICHFM